MEAVKSNLAALMNLAQPSARSKTKESGSSDKFREFLSETRQDTRKETAASSDDKDVSDEPVVNEAAALLFTPRILEYLNTVQMDGNLQGILPIQAAGIPEEALSQDLSEMAAGEETSDAGTQLLSELVQEGTGAATPVQPLLGEEMKQPEEELSDDKADIQPGKAETNGGVNNALPQEENRNQPSENIGNQDASPDGERTGMMQTMSSGIQKDSRDQSGESVSKTEGNAEEVSLSQMMQKDFHDVTEPATDVVTVKAEQPEELSQKLLEQIMKKASMRQKEFEVQLEPHNLGKISIKINYSENHTTVSVLCTEAKTLNLLSEHAKEMGAILETNLGTPTNIFVEKQDSNYLDQQKSDDSQKGWSGQEKNHSGKNRDGEQNASDFIQKLRLGIVSGFEME